jgi:hypothetical protein
MLVAILSYILLKLYLVRLKAKSGAEISEADRAEAVAKVDRIVNVVDRIVSIWFRLLLWVLIILFAVVIITLLISIFGISAESSWLYSIELWSYGTIAQIVGEYGIGKAISTISIAVVLFGALSALAIWLLNNKKLWKHKS